MNKAVLTIFAVMALFVGGLSYYLVVVENVGEAKCYRIAAFEPACDPQEENLPFFLVGVIGVPIIIAVGVYTAKDK